MTHLLRSINNSSQKWDPGELCTILQIFLLLWLYRLSSLPLRGTWESPPKSPVLAGIKAGFLKNVLLSPKSAAPVVKIHAVRCDLLQNPVSVCVPRWAVSQSVELSEMSDRNFQAETWSIRQAALIRAICMAEFPSVSFLNSMGHWNEVKERSFGGGLGQRKRVERQRCFINGGLLLNGFKHCRAKLLVKM